MGAWISAFACGVIILYSGLFAPASAITLSGLLLALLVPVCWLTRGASVARFLLPLLAFLGGLLWAGAQALAPLQDRLPAHLEGQRLSVTGYLCNAPAPGAWGSVRFSLCVTGSETRGVPRRLRLSWYGDDATLALPSPLAVEVVLKRPHGAVNPGGFRYESWLFRKGYGATGTVRSVAARPNEPCPLSCRYHRWRQQLVLASAAQLDGMTHRGLARSLLLGYRGELSNEHWEVLNATGTIHLVAISGLHLGLVAVLAGVVLRWLASCLPGRWRAVRGTRAGIWLLVALAAAGYALLAGFTVPTRRALVMVIIAGWLVLAGRVTTPWRGWLLALGMVLALDPRSPLDQGFWLSFGAVAVLILVFSHRNGRVHPVKALIIAQLAVFAGLWPILAVLDQGASITGLLANLLAIPWLSLVVMPMLVTGGVVLTVLPASPGTVTMMVGSLFDLVLAPLWWGLTALADLDVPGGQQSLLVTLAFAVAVVSGLWLPDRRYRLAVVVMVVLLVVELGWSAWNPAAVKRNRWQATPELWVWDVGQGLSILVHHQDQTLLYDTGPESMTGYSAVGDVLKPSLDRIGVNRIDTVVLSHGDRDHAGGLEVLFRHYQPQRVVSGEPERILEQRGVVGPIGPCGDQPAISVGQVKVRFWQTDTTVGESNDRSCVVILEFGMHQVILPGDIGTGVEAELLRAEPALVRARGRKELTLVAPHHGSKTSSGVPWVNKLRPERVIFTAGYRHRYGHPHPDVVDRYRAVDSDMINTATSGALRIRLEEAATAEVIRWRTRAPFWIRRAEEL